MGLGSRMFQGMVWSAFGRIFIQVAQFSLGIILARILSPKEYGIFAILLVFITVSKVFVDSGFTKALIQKKDRTEDDISTVFLFNIGISLFFYALLWFASPYIENFYKTESLALYIRVLSLTLITNALFTVPNTLITIRLDFKKLTIINFITTITSGGIAVYLAYIGFGIWALVFQTLFRSILTAIIIWLWFRWKPNWVFSKTSFKELFSYGSKLLISSLLTVLFTNLNTILIGKYINTKDLGFYSRGKQFSDVMLGVFNSTFGVLLPGLSPLQDQKEVLVAHTRTIIRASALISVPIFIGLSVMAEPIIKLLLTDKWLIAVPIMKIYCLARLITVTSGINLNLLYVTGRTDLALKQEVLKIAVRVVLVIFALQYGIIYIAFAELLTTAIHFSINTYYPGKLMKYGAFKQIKDIFPILLAGVVMAAGMYSITLIIQDSLIQLSSAVLMVPLYLLLIYWFKIPELNLILSKTKEFIGKK